MDTPLGSDDTEEGGIGFTYQTRKNADVEVFHYGKLAATLRGTAADDFLRKAQTASSAQMQQLMARLTGNYKHGNERAASNHPRNRR